MSLNRLINSQNVIVNWQAIFFWCSAVNEMRRFILQSIKWTFHRIVCADVNINGIILSTHANETIDFNNAIGKFLIKVRLY